MEMDPLISENEHTDWFMYDDESLDFLINMEKVEFVVEQKVKISSETDKKIYFQDKHRDMLLDDCETKPFLLKSRINNVTLVLL